MASGHSINIYPDGTIERYRDSKLHHTTGPAVERSDGTKEWWVNGEQITEEEFNKRLTLPQ
jgi:hypothetical protein